MINPINSTPSETRIDLRLVKRAVAEGIQEYKEKNSSACMNFVGFLIVLALMVTILAFILSVLKAVYEIRDKVGA